MKPQPKALALGTVAAILSFIGGMLGMYYTQESRIEKRTEERVRTAVALADIKAELAKLDSREWDNSRRSQEAIKQL